MQEQLAQILSGNQDEHLANRFDELVEERIVFGGSADDYFASMFRLPSPLLELYATLIFDSTVRSDGLADAIPLYDCPGFIEQLQKGLQLLEQPKLWSIIDRARQHLRSPESTALQSNAPNVTLDRETGGILKEYFATNEELMARIGYFLRKNRDLVLDKARTVGKLRVASNG
jgi:hypothetical protein